MSEEFWTKNKPILDPYPEEEDEELEELIAAVEAEVRKETSPVTAPSPVPANTGTVSGKTYLRVRKAPRAASPILGVLGEGTVVSIVSTSNGWHKIVYKNGHGYVPEVNVK